MQIEGMSGLFRTKEERDLYQKVLKLKSTLSTYPKTYIIELIHSLSKENKIKGIDRLVYYPMSEFDTIMKDRLLTLNLLELVKNGAISFSDDYFQIDKYNGSVHSINENDYTELIDEYMEWISRIILENDCTLEEKLQERKNKILET